MRFVKLFWKTNSQLTTFCVLQFCIKVSQYATVCFTSSSKIHVVNLSVHCALLIITLNRQNYCVPKRRWRFTFTLSIYRFNVILMLYIYMSSIHKYQTLIIYPDILGLLVWITIIDEWTFVLMPAYTVHAKWYKISFIVYLEQTK